MTTSAARSVPSASTTCYAARPALLKADYGVAQRSRPRASVQLGNDASSSLGRICACGPSASSTSPDRYPACRRGGGNLEHDEAPPITTRYAAAAIWRCSASASSSVPSTWIPPARGCPDSVAGRRPGRNDQAVGGERFVADRTAPCFEGSRVVAGVPESQRDPERGELSRVGERRHRRGRQRPRATALTTAADRMAREARRRPTRSSRRSRPPASATLARVPATRPDDDRAHRTRPRAYGG